MNKDKDISRRSFLQSVVGVFAVSSASFMALVSSGCSPDTGSNAGDSDSDAERTTDSDASDQSGRSTISESDSSDSDQSDQQVSSDSDQSDQSGRSMSDSDQVTAAPSSGGEGTDSDDSGRR